MKRGESTGSDEERDERSDRDGATSRTTGGSGSAWTRSQSTVAALAALLVIAVVAVVWLGVAWRQERQDAADLQQRVDAGVSAEEASREILTDMMTYSYETLEEDFAWLDQSLQPEFAERYRPNVEAIKEFVADNEFIYTGTVADLAHRVEGENTVVILAFVDQDVTNAAGDYSAQEEYRVRVVLTREDESDSWIVENIELLGGQNAIP